MVKVNYLCIGVQKGGTTSLIHYMNQHPDIYMYHREINMFSKKRFLETDTQKYEDMFETDKKFVGEKGPYYCYLFYAIDRIYNYNPDMKLILLVREPIARAYSQYNVYLKRDGLLGYQEVTKEFRYEVFLNRSLKNLERIGKDYFIQGFYDEQIEYILSKFPRENLYIGVSEEIKRDKQAEYNKIFNFLGTSDYEIDTNLDTNIRTYDKPLDTETVKMLYDVFKPHNERLYEILGRRITLWDEYYQSVGLE